MASKDSTLFANGDDVVAAAEDNATAKKGTTSTTESEKVSDGKSSQEYNQSASSLPAASSTLDDNDNSNNESVMPRVIWGESVDGDSAAGEGDVGKTQKIEEAAELVSVVEKELGLVARGDLSDVDATSLDAVKRVKAIHGMAEVLARSSCSLTQPVVDVVLIVLGEEDSWYVDDYPERHAAAWEAGIVPALSALAQATRPRLQPDDLAAAHVPSSSLLGDKNGILGSLIALPFQAPEVAHQISQDEHLIAITLLGVSYAQGSADPDPRWKADWFTVKNRALNAAANCIGFTANESDARKWLPMAPIALDVLTHRGLHQNMTIENCLDFTRKLSGHAGLRAGLRVIGASPNPSLPLQVQSPLPSPSRASALPQADVEQREPLVEVLATIADEGKSEHGAWAGVVALALLVGDVEDHPAVASLSSTVLSSLLDALKAALCHICIPGTDCYPKLAPVSEAVARLAVADSNKPTLVQVDFHTTIAASIGSPPKPIDPDALSHLLHALGHLTFDKDGLKGLQAAADTFVPKLRTMVADPHLLDDLRDAARDVVNQIIPPVLEDTATRSSKAKADQARKLMISYSWANKVEMRALSRALQTAGYDVWLDIDQMNGDINAAMASAVELADFIVVGVSRNYKESINCRRELSYAQSLDKPIIPIMVQEGYRADGWLGLILAGMLWYDLTHISFVGNVTQEVMKAGDQLMGSSDDALHDESSAENGVRRSSVTSEIGGVRRSSVTSEMGIVSENKLEQMMEKVTERVVGELVKSRAEAVQLRETMEGINETMEGINDKMGKLVSLLTDMAKSSNTS